MATLASAAIVELAKQLEIDGLELEGFDDDASVNLKPRTRDYVDGRRTAYQRRQMLEHAAKAALEDLIADGYPGFPVLAVDVETYDDLQQQITSMTAALKKVAPTAVASLGLQAGAIFVKK